MEFTDLDGMTDDLWDRILSTNLKGPWLCSKAVAPVMQRQQQGRIVSVASIAGLRPSGSSIAYAISKAGVIHLTRCLAVALAPHVLVNAVAPGFMEGTGMTVNLSDAFHRRHQARFPPEPLGQAGGRGCPDRGLRPQRHDHRPDGASGCGSGIPLKLALTRG